MVIVNWNIKGREIRVGVKYYCMAVSLLFCVNEQAAYLPSDEAPNPSLSSLIISLSLTLVIIMFVSITASSGGLRNRRLDCLHGA